MINSPHVLNNEAALFRSRHFRNKRSAHIHQPDHGELRSNGFFSPFTNYSIEGEPSENAHCDRKQYLDLSPLILISLSHPQRSKNSVLDLLQSLSSEKMFRPIAPPIRSSGLRLNSVSRQQEALKMANYWLQFAANQTAMVQQAMEHARIYFAEASQCLERPCTDCAPVELPVEHHQEVNNQRLVRSSIAGPNGEPLAFSAKGMAAIDKLMGVHSAVASASATAPQASSAQPAKSGNKSATTEPLLYPSQLDSPIDLTPVHNSGTKRPDPPSPTTVSSSHQHTLPFHLHPSADSFTYHPTNPFSQALRAHATEAANMQADLEEIQEQIDEIIEGQGCAVDTDTLRRLDFDRMGLFVPAVEEEQRQVEVEVWGDPDVERLRRGYRVSRRGGWI